MSLEGKVGVGDGDGRVLSAAGDLEFWVGGGIV
jgi:hypothetical protein